VINLLCTSMALTCWPVKESFWEEEYFAKIRKILITSSKICGFEWKFLTFDQIQAMVIIRPKLKIARAMLDGTLSFMNLGFDDGPSPKSEF
jgi:hypothetical protein